MGKTKVLITGATGYIASLILPIFREKFELVLLDTHAVDQPGEQVEGAIITDVGHPDRETYARHFEGVDAVVHLAIHTSSRTTPIGVRYLPKEEVELPPIDDYAKQRANLDMNYNIMRTAFEAGASRFVFASSHGAASWYNGLVAEGNMDIVDPSLYPLSTSFYGWAKAVTEQLGFMFASGAFGRKMGNVNIRIGVPAEPGAFDRSGEDVAYYKGRLSGYVSQRDLAQLFARAIETPNIDNDQGVSWLVAYGYSNNTRAVGSLASGRRVLGYRPQDDSEVKFADDIRERLKGGASTQEKAG